MELLQTACLMAMAGYWGWCLRTMRIEPGRPTEPPKTQAAEIGNVVLDLVRDARFHKAMIGKGFGYVATGRLHVHGGDPVYLAISTDAFSDAESMIA